MDHGTVTEVTFGGTAWRIDHGGASAVVASRGATLISWDPGVGESIIDGYESPEELAQGNGSRSRILAPYPGRVNRGTFTWNGRKITLPVASDGHARHGFVSSLDFVRVSTGSTLQLRGEHEANEEWPWSFAVDVVFALGEGDGRTSHLSIDISLTNLSAEAAPAGLGWHPLVRFPGGGKITDLGLTIPARKKVSTSQDLIPLPGESAYAGILAPVAMDRIGRQSLDIAYMGLVPNDEGVVRTSLKNPLSGRTISLVQEPAAAPVVVVWTADGLDRGAREAVALEPYSHVPDAVNRADASASIGLAPGATRSMTATLVYA